MQSYSSLFNDSNQEIAKVLRQIIETRSQDVKDFDNLHNIFMRGRKVGKIPAASNDTAATDRVGDFNYDPDYLYLAVDDTGLGWRRIPLETW